METNKIRVCFVSPKAYPLFNPAVEKVFGGAEVDLYYLGTELAKDRQFDVSFVTADYGQAPLEYREGVTLIKSLNFDKNPVTGALAIWNALRRANADIYMIKSISAGLGLTCFFCRVYGRRFVYRTAHSTHCDGTYLNRHFWMGKMFVRSLKRADRVFVQSEQDGRNLKKTTGVSSIVLPNGHRVNPLAEQQRDCVLWVGRSADFKRPDRFLRLAASLPNERFVMICPEAFGDKAYAALRGEAAKVSNLTFIEHVRFDQIDEWFARAKVLVSTSDSEGFPNTFIQACKAGAAILSLAVNPDGFLDRYQCGICAQGSEPRLLEELRRLLNNDLYLALGRNGRDYVQRYHNVADIAEVYKKTFRELV
ncbi:MAG: glycosyltransferase family 4 protein [Planctomycetaceae bacterium]|nr:glycosyltransferase family 4 protein [Planctomycetaceae bacterium]